MRVVSLIIVLAFASKVGVAQTDYKLDKGNITTELQLSLFNTSGKIHYNDDDETVSYLSTGPLSLSGLRLRYAFSEKLALRATVGLDFGHNSTKRKHDDIITDFNGIPIGFGKGSSMDKSKHTEFSVAPGIEYHFGNWERMSVYFAGEVLFGMRMTNGSSEMEVEITDFLGGGMSNYKILTTLKTKNCEETRSYYPYYTPSYRQNGVFYLGIAASIGMDFYIYKGLYLGAELGLGYLYANALKGSVTVSTKINGVTSEPVDIKLDDKINSGNLAFRCNPMIRIGWKF